MLDTQNFLSKFSGRWIRLLNKMNPGRKWCSKLA